MAYTIKINTGSGLVTFTNVEFDGGTLEKQKTGQNEVVTFDGTIRFTGDDYTTLKALVTSVHLPCELYRDTELEIDGYIDLRGKWNESEKYCELSLVNDTPNEQFVKAYGEELEPLSFSPSITATLFEYEPHLTFFYVRKYSLNGGAWIYLDTAPATATNYEYWALTYPYLETLTTGADTIVRHLDIYAREQYTVSEEVAQIYINDTPNWDIVTDNGDGTVIIARTFTDAGLSQPIVTVAGVPISGLKEFDANATAPNYLPSTANTEFQTGDVVQWYFNEIQFPALGSPSFAAYEKHVWTELGTYYTQGSEPYKNFRNVTELIRDWCYNNVPDIYFDEDSFEFEDFTHNNANDYPYANMLLASIQDVIPATGGNVQKSGLNTNLTTSLKEILDWFAQQLSVYWYIEVVSDTYYFRMAHISQITASASGIDLTNYKGEDWSEDLSIYEFDSNVVREVRRNTLSGSIDFYNNSIIFNNFKDITDNKMEWDGSKILTDLVDIWQYPAKYPSTSNTQMFMCACNGKSASVGATLITSWSNIDLGTFATTGTNVSGSGAGSCQSNTFSVTAGSVYLFQMATADVDSELSIEVSTNTYNPFKVIRQDMHRILVIARDSSASATIKLTNTSGDFALTSCTCGLQTETQKQTRGELSQSVVPNGDLSLANLNRYSNIYDLEDDDINVNNVDITGNKGKKKKLEIEAPIDYLSDLSLRETVVHGLGAVEVTSISIPMDESFAKLSCKF